MSVMCLFILELVLVQTLEPMGHLPRSLTNHKPSILLIKMLLVIKIFINYLILKFNTLACINLSGLCKNMNNTIEEKN